MKKIKKLIFKIIIVGIIGYVIFLFINQCLKIQKKSEELSDINRQISAQKDENQKIKNKLENNNSESDTEKGVNSKKFGTVVFENVTE